MIRVARYRPAYIKAHRADLGEVLRDQAHEVQSLWEQHGRTDVFDQARWNRLLGERIAARNKLTATDFGNRQAHELGTGFDPAGLDQFVASSAERSAENINGATFDQFKAAAGADQAGELVPAVFHNLVSGRLEQLAVSSVTTSSVLGLVTAAEQGNQRFKTWLVTSGNPRPEHAVLDGETVGLSDMFSNGMRWPGDPSGDVSQVAGCQCSVDFGE